MNFGFFIGTRTRCIFLRRRLAWFACALPVAWFAYALPAGATDRLQLSGELPASTVYRLQVDYKTTVNRADCQFDDYITGMRIPLSETRYFEPIISGNQHELGIALSYPETATADTSDCHWQPKVISICLGLQHSQNAVNCVPLFIIGRGDPAPASLKLSCDSKWVCVGGDADSALRREISGFARPLRLDISVQGQP